MSPIALTLYGRPDCHLCHEMADLVVPVAHELHCELKQIDISGNPGLEAEFGTEIPVLLINGRKAFKYRLTSRELRRRLAVENRKQTSPRDTRA